MLTLSKLEAKHSSVRHIKSRLSDPDDCNLCIICWHRIVITQIFISFFPRVHALKLAERMLVRQEPHLLLKSLDMPVRLLWQVSVGAMQTRHHPWKKTTENQRHRERARKEKKKPNPIIHPFCIRGEGSGVDEGMDTQQDRTQHSPSYVTAWDQVLPFIVQWE